MTITINSKAKSTTTRPSIEATTTTASPYSLSYDRIDESEGTIEIVAVVAPFEALSTATTATTTTAMERDMTVDGSCS